MDIQAELNWIHQEIDKVNDPTFVDKLKHLLQFKNSEATNSDIDYNIDIEKSLESIKKGHFYSQEQAREISKKWGRK